MQTRYDPPTLERHWQTVWTRTGIYQTDLRAERPFYNLMRVIYVPRRIINIVTAS
jgi:hypothetical protein